MKTIIYEILSKIKNIAKSFSDYFSLSQNKPETARLMKLKNFDNNLIMEMTGLSKAEVERL